MEKITHKTVHTNGINLHVAEIGQGPAVLFLHGFPELWYTWRHQMLSLASRGYRAIAPDLRGFGDSDAPASVSSYTYSHIVGDLVGLLDALGLDRVFLVGHDWGAAIAWYLCLFRPDRITALVNLSVVFQRRNPQFKPIETLRSILGDNYYIIQFQEPGKIERKYAEVGTLKVMRNFLIRRDPSPPMLTETIGFGGVPYDQPVELPSWLSEEDVLYYAKKYNQTGFTGGLNYYRASDLNWELTAPWTGAKLQVPVKFIIGDLDVTYYMPGVKDYIHSGGFKEDVPLLEELVIMEGVAHFINQERAEEISDHIYEYIKKF